MTDHKALIAEARRYGVTESSGSFKTDALLDRLADALEAASAERAVVEAQALEQAAAYANQMHAEQGGLGEARIRADWLRERAVEIREGRA